MGAYLSFFGPFPPFTNLGGLAGVYRTPAIYADVYGVFTNTTPTAHGLCDAARRRGAVRRDRAASGADRSEPARRQGPRGKPAPSAGMPCVMSAVLDALGSIGAGDFEMPATPERIWRVIRDRADFCFAAGGV